MTQFRSKPKLVEAVQWSGLTVSPTGPDWLVEALREGAAVVRQNHDEGVLELRVTTCSDIWRYAQPGEWIVKGLSKHRFTVLDQATFTDRYEPV